MNMRAVVFLGARDVRLVEQPVPQPGEGQVRLKVALALLHQRRIDPAAQGTHTIDLAELPAYLLGQVNRVDGKLIARPGGLDEALP